MAKPKRTVEDLDAELAALEAELAALEGKPKKAAPPKPKKAKAAKPEPAPAPPVEPEAAEPAPEPAGKKSRFALPKKPSLKLPRRRKGNADEAPPAEAEPSEAEAAPEAPAAAPAPAPPPAALLPTFDASLWRRDGDAWVRTVPSEPRVVRRVLDEQGNVVREESASRRDLDEATGVKAERGVGKLLGRFRR